MSTRTILILGGGIAGVAAAHRARELDTHARIVLIDENRRVRPAPQGLAALLGAPAAAQQVDPAAVLVSDFAVEVWSGAEVVGLFPHRHAVTVRRDNGDAVVPYDTLVYALGARPIVPHWRADNLVALDAWADLDTVDRIWERGGRSAVVLGSGATAVEAATGLVREGWTVTLVAESDRLLPGYDTVYSELSRRGLSSSGVRVLLGEKHLEAEIHDDAARRLVLSGDRSVDVDLVVAALGREPRTALLPATAVAADGTVRIDLQGRTTLADVFAAGSCVSTPRTVTGEHVWLPLPALDDRVGQVAGANAAGGDARLAPALGGELVQAGRMLVGRVGLTLREAAAYTSDLRTSTAHGPPHDDWVPGAEPVTLTLLWDGRDGRVLGAEGGGIHGVDKRLDAIGVAVATGMPVWMLASLDLAYSPAVSRVRDVVNVVATIATQDRLGRARATRDVKAGALLLDLGPGQAPRLPGALRLPLEGIRDHIAHLDRGRAVITACPDGRRSALAAEMLVHAGFSDVRYVEGGLWNWELMGRALERG